ncbi:MAG TPA: glycerophosphodiester phosphodiesterase family protein, partial [Bacilli bacterium]|nr:glycerophosphodiester phosphodiesterase family protein [Bacilli bacterium]
MNPKPLMIAHRGASVYELENTKEAFIAAGNRTFWGIETDIRLTKDGEIVIFHDETLKRLAGMEAKVSDFDFAEVREISLKGRFDHIEASRIPTLSEYL